MNTRTRILRALELILFFGVVPYLYRPYVNVVPPIPLLFLVFGFCLIVLRRDRSFDRRRLWNRGGVRGQLKPILLHFAAAGVALIAFTLIIAPDHFLEFPRRVPGIWLMVMVLYPVFSVYPQELVYRTFFFHRYRELFPGPWAMVLASALAFGWVHIVFGSWVSVVLSSLGGVLFARTYQRSESTLAAGIEHALYGCYVFTLGLGYYFYHGAAR